MSKLSTYICWSLASCCLMGIRLEAQEIVKVKYAFIHKDEKCGEYNTSTFKPFDSFTGCPASPDSVLWLRIQIAGSNQLSRPFLYIDAWRSAHFFHHIKLVDAQCNNLAQGGYWLSNDQLSLPENRYALRVPPSTADLHWYQLAIEPLVAAHLFPFNIELISQTDAVQQRALLRVSKHSETIVLYGMFYAIIITCLMVASYQYYYYREKAYAFYMLYMVGIALVYVRGIEGPFGNLFTVAGNWGKMLYGLETTFQYMVFGAYVFFLYHFLNIKQYGKKWVDKIFSMVGRCLFSMIIIDIGLQLFFGQDVSRFAYHIFRAFLIPVCFAGLLGLMIYARSPLFWYILAGTALLLIPSAFTAFEQWSHGWLGFYTNRGFYRSFTFYDSQKTILMYSTRIGVMLEIICFGLGLLYRNRRVIEDLQRQYAPLIPPSNDGFLMQVQNVFQENLSNENYDIAQMCRDLGLSKAALYQKIKAATATTPIAYLRAMRLEEARRLLHATDRNISEIAYSVGYRDPNFFTRVFTKEFGVSPKRMREG